MTQTLLIELLTEELPPKALNSLGNHFAQSIADGLEKAQLIDGTAQFTAYASPRRLAVAVANVKPVQAEQHIVRKGVSVAAGMKDGAPTKALEGFARSCGVAIGSLKTLETRSRQANETQIFIETPYRNEALLADALATLHPHTRLCIACDLTLPSQQIISQSIHQWRKMPALPSLKKRPAIFVLHAGQ